MERMDNDLAFMLKYENVAWYEDGMVKILDRRVYPMEVRYEICKSYKDVAKAIKNMVTQSAGPYTAAAMGMALAAYECRNETEQKQTEFLKNAAFEISNARPTTKNRMEKITKGSLDRAVSAMKSGKCVYEELFNDAVDSLNRRYKTMSVVGENLANLFPKDGKVMTQCFGETIVGTMLRECNKRGNKIKLYCPETRPYLQGARLTASVAIDMGFDVTVITDNMPACVMKLENIDLFTSAADSIVMDGSVINKVGTYQIAINAKYHGIPYFVTGIPDGDVKSISNVKIEQRDPEFALEFMGKRVVKEKVKGYYPAFDITPPHLVSGVVTDKGIFSPYNLNEYFKGEVNRYY